MANTGLKKSRQLAALAEAFCPDDGWTGGRSGVCVVMDTVTSLLNFTYTSLDTLVCSLPPAAFEEPSLPPAIQLLVAELTEALESSQVLEHAAQALLRAQVAAGAHAGGSGSVGAPLLSPGSVIALHHFIHVHTYLGLMTYNYCRSADAATAALGAQLWRALRGPCMMHAALVLGLSTLVPYRGSSYGLDEIVTMPSVRAVAGAVPRR
ncbi:hypothetical protein GPECTOR_56g369 [Gonium pectorale]|uniref:Uncharacterized protein n=1 Tax=Gonium pectorale TaxID=33097 RepID=A0A150G678_GONPE|nr:hypothetical protein GPECTOR_56g369 [Gonium pectorale]|eukprot:KXZ45273.1 hypothetical protein GPECTOR_56g369 [Gonium pectorale]